MFLLFSNSDGLGDPKSLYPSEFILSIPPPPACQQAYRPNSAVLFGNCPQTQKSPEGAGQTPSVKPCGFATSLSEGGNPLSHRCAMPAPPRGGAYLLQTVRCLKAPPSRNDFPRPGQILPAPGRNVTAGDKERSRCHASDKKGNSGIASAMTEGVPERNKRPSEMQLKMPQMVFFCFVNSAHSARRNPIPSAPARSRWRPAQCSCVRCGCSAACRRHRKRQRWSLCPASM